MNISEWTPQDLERYLEGVAHTLPHPPSLRLDELHSTRLLSVEKELALGTEAIAYLKSLGLDTQVLPSNDLVTPTTRATNLTLSTVQGTLLGPTTSFTFDGSTSCYVEFYAYEFVRGTASALTLELFQDTTSQGIVLAIQGLTFSAPLFARSPLITPAAGAHTFTLKAAVDAGTTSVVQAGAGGAGTGTPMQLRVIRA